MPGLIHITAPTEWCTATLGTYLKVDNPFTQQQKQNDEGRKTARALNQSRKYNYIRAGILQGAGGLCTENFLSLLPLFSWHANNVLASQRGMLPEHCNYYTPCQMLKRLLEILLNKVLCMFYMGKNKWIPWAVRVRESLKPVTFLSDACASLWCFPFYSFNSPTFNLSLIIVF